MEKTVKGATKPKHHAPKAKYIDQIIASTHSTDGSFHDVCRALAARLRDSNSTVIFKSLIVVHTLVRAGNQETVLGFLSGTKMLGLESVVSGYDTAQNLSKYASYLDRRIRTYGAIKYDIIRDKSERRGERDGPRGCNRLRHLSVDKGLLRETTLLQKEMDSLAECKFYLDDMDDDLTMTALRMLVKDLLMIFQAVNEGVINVLEHYFEMSKTDAATALKIYKRFCVQTENVVSYLAVAKKMQNIINVQIPNLKHAPVSLSASLEEYLNDPNFEQNRKEYKENSRVVDGRPPSRSPAPAGDTTPSKAKPSTPEPQTATSNAEGSNNKKSFTDFFSSIEAEQPNMFNPQTGSPTQHYFQQQAAHNPFMNRPQSMMMMNPQMTGFGMQPQPTGFMQPQQTGFPQQQQQPHQNGFLQPQMTVFAPGGMLQPQATGSYNPFRQSMLMPQSTGFVPSMQPQNTGMQPRSNPFLSASAPSHSNSGGPSQQFQGLQPQLTGAFRPQSSLFSVPESGQPSAQPPPPMPQSSSSPAPFASQSSSAQQQLSVPGQSASPKPLMPQPTGSRNPFAPPPEEMERRAREAAEAAKPQAPSMNQMAFSAFQQRSQQQLQPQPTANQQSQTSTPFSAPSQPAPLSSQATGGGGLFANVASSFATSAAPQSSGAPAVSSTPAFPPPASSPAPAPLSSQPTGFGGSTVKPFQPSSGFGQAMSAGDSNPPLNVQSTGLPPASSAAPMASQPTGFGSQSQPFQTSTSPAPIAPQPTGFGGSQVKPFQPSSSFGASLAQNLPSVPAQATGTSSSAGVTAQSTGGSAFNPFRASMAPTTSTGNSTPGTSLFSQPTGGGSVGGFNSSFGAFPSSSGGTGAPPQNKPEESWESKFSSTFGAFGTGFKSADQQQQQQQNQQESLI